MPRKVLSLFLVALLVVTGGLTGAVACTELGSAHSYVHSAHEAHGLHGHDAASPADEWADQRDAEQHGPSGQDSSGVADCDECMHMHAHCCASIALPVADNGLRLALTPGATLTENGSPLPLGQLFYPLLRPPRTSA